MKNKWVVSGFIIAAVGLAFLCQQVSGYVCPTVVEVEGRRIVYNDGLDNFKYPTQVSAWVANWEPEVQAWWDCDDYALNMIKDAYSDNFIMGFVLTGTHMKVCAIENNRIWFIEPQSKGISRLHDRKYWVLDK